MSGARSTRASSAILSSSGATTSAGTRRRSATISRDRARRGVALALLEIGDALRDALTKCLHHLGGRAGVGPRDQQADRALGHGKIAQVPAIHAVRPRDGRGGWADRRGVDDARDEALGERRIIARDDVLHVSLG